MFEDILGNVRKIEDKPVLTKTNKEYKQEHNEVWNTGKVWSTDGEAWSTKRIDPDDIVDDSLS